MFDIEENLKQLPALPGVYIHKDADGEVIYVGKASSLKNRVRQYFRSSGQDAKTAALASHITEFEYIVTKTEAEALLLENTLIKRYRPRYNIMLRDDKTYPYIKITLGEEWPRLLKTRVLASDGSKYFGPYADVGAVNRIIELLNDVYRLKRCTNSTFPKGHRPCLHGDLDRCRRMCIYSTPAIPGREGFPSADENASARDALHAEYSADIGKIIAFLKGNSADVEKYITARMNETSARMDYEEAARWRDYLASAKSVTEKQRVELLSSGSMDIVLGNAAAGADDVQTSGSVRSRTVTVFFVRDGKLVGRERHLLDTRSDDANRKTANGVATGDDPDRGTANGVAAGDDPDRGTANGVATGDDPDRVTANGVATGDTIRAAADASAPATVAAFISQYYANQSQPPKEILLEAHIPDEQLIADALTDAAGYKVKIHVPERGAKKELVRLAQNDVNEAARRDEQRRAAAEKKQTRLREQFTDIFGDFATSAPAVEQRIEAYDISHTGGADSVGAMVVFTDGKPDKSSYRRFKIRGETRGDDYAAMQEVLYRRLRRGLEGDKSFLPLPSLMLIDGGKGHLTAALQVIEAMKKSEAQGADLSEIQVAGMVKDDHHRTRALVVPAPQSNATSQANAAPQAAAPDTPGASFTEHDLKEKRELFHLTGAIQEEVHRFAIEYHRKRRSKRMVGEE